MDFDREIVAVYDKLLQAASSYCRDDGAHDLAAEAVTRALEHRDCYDPSRPLLSWCRAIMRNLWINAGCRLESLNTVRMGDEDCDGGARPDVVTENNDALKIIRSIGSASVAVDTLLEFAQGYSLAEIAERRGIPLGTVKRRIHDGRAMVHKALS